MVTIENPGTSYLWPFLDSQDVFAGVAFTDVLLCMCRFGAPYRKPTRLRTFSVDLSELELGCTLRKGLWTCNRTKAQGHEVLEFGGKCISEAAAYSPGLVNAWAEVLQPHPCRDGGF